MSGQVTAEMRLRARQRLMAMELPADDRRHGRWTTYVNYACRCHRCTESWRARSKVKRQRASRKARRALL